MSSKSYYMIGWTHKITENQGWVLDPTKGLDSGVPWRSDSAVACKVKLEQIRTALGYANTYTAYLVEQELKLW